MPIDLDMKSFCLLALLLSVFWIESSVSSEGTSSFFSVYSIYQGVHLGGSDEIPQKDYYINVGSAHGVKKGSVLEVMRKVVSYDLLETEHYQDLHFPIAFLRVIHAESRASIARLEKMLPIDKTPTLFPRAIMVGDWVRLVDELRLTQ